MSLTYDGGGAEESFKAEFLEVQEYEQRTKAQGISSVQRVGLTALLAFNVAVVVLVIVRVVRKRKVQP